MSSVCVTCGLASTGGSCFLPPLAPGAPPFLAPLPFVVSRLGVSYFTSECSGGPGMLYRNVRNRVKSGERDVARLLAYAEAQYAQDQPNHPPNLSGSANTFRTKWNERSQAGQGPGRAG